MKNFLQVNRASTGAKKNFYFNLNQIKSNPDGEPTVNRQSRLMSYRGNLKNLAMLFAVLMLSIANIATAWGTSATITIGNSPSSSYAATFASSSTNANITAGATAFSYISSKVKTSSSTDGAATAPYSIKFMSNGNINTSNYLDGYSISASFKVALGYTFTPTSISTTIVPEAASYSYKAILTDGVTTYTSSEISSSAKTPATFVFPSLSGTGLKGDVIFKIMFKSTANNSKWFIVNLPITIVGDVANDGGTPPSTSPDTPGASGTINFKDWVTSAENDRLTANSVTYWKDGIKFYQYHNESSWSTYGGWYCTAPKVFLPKYNHGLSAGDSWGGAHYSISGLTAVKGHAFTISVTGPCDIEVVVHNNKLSWNSNYNIYVDDVAYGTAYATNGTKDCTGTNITSSATISHPDESTGRYVVTVPISQSFFDDNNTNGVLCVKFGSSVSSWGEGALFFYESVTVTPIVSCTAPSTVTVAPTAGIDGNYGWRYTTGETIDLTCTASGGSGGSYTYQWQKYIGSSWEDIDGATNARFQKENCTSSDGGSYRCVVSTGEGCSKGSDEALGHGYYVRVFTLDGNYYGSAWNKNAITWTGENTGTVTLSLEKSRTFEFKVRDNDQKEFGYTAGNYIIQPWSNNCGSGDGTNIRLFTGPAGDYTITLNVEHANDVSAYVNVDVAYPSVTHPVDGYIYLTKWAWDPYVHYWDGSGSNLTADGSDPKITTYTEICEGNYYWYFPVLDNYVNFLVKDNTKESSATNKSGSQTTTSHSGMLLTNNDSWVWQEVGYTVSFNANGGTGTMDAIKHLCSGANQVIPTNAFSRSGWEFTGWNTSKYGNGTPYAAGATIEGITGDITLYAQWKKTVYLEATGDYTWWYNKNGDYDAWYAIYYWDSSADSKDGWVAMELANCETTVYKATLPGNGYDKLIFVRKSSDKTHSWTGVHNQTMNIDYPTSNPKFSINDQHSCSCGDNGKLKGSWSTYSTPTFTISYNQGSTSYTNGNSISGSKSNQSKTCSVDFTLPDEAVFTTTGYTQTGWATTEGTKAYDLGDDYTTDVAQTFYPYWTPKSYTLTWDLAGGTVTVAGTGADVDATGTPSSSVNYNAAISKPTVTKTGYNFAGWDETPATNMPASDKTYTATWTAKTTSITLDKNNSDESGTANGSVTATYGSSTLTSLSHATRTGYTVSSYKTGTSGGQIIVKGDGTLNTGNKTGYLEDGIWINESAEATLYAQWEANKYDINYYDGGATDNIAFSGSHADGYPTKHTYGSSTTLKSATKTGYTFGGWFDNYSCTDDAVTSIGATAITSNTKLYAKWTINSHTLTWNFNGGEYDGKNGAAYTAGGTKDYNTSITYPESEYMSKSGYVFNGWSTDASTMPDENLTITAQWTRVYTVTYASTGSTSGSAPSDSNSPYTSGSTVTVLGNTGSLVKTGNVFLGWSDGSGNNYAPGETFTISGNTTLSPIWKDGTSATVTYTMAVGSEAAWSVSGSSSETTSIPSAGITVTTTNAGISGTGTGSKENKRTSQLAIQTTAQGATYDNPTNYILYNFSVASGYAFTPSDISIVVANVGSSSGNNIKYKVVLSDGNSHSINATYIAPTDGQVYTFHVYNEEAVTFEGNVTLKLWAWKINDGNGSAYRLGTPLTIAGVTESTCSTPADPDGLAVGSITSSGATFTITDDESPASYEIYYSTSSTAPTSGTAASATTTSKTKAVTGLNPSTTYYAWVRAVCNASYKSDWVALTGSSFETEVMSLPATLDKSNVTAVSDDTYWSDDNTYYDYGSEDAANTSRYQDWVVYVMPCTYEVSVVMNYTGTGGGTQWGLYLLDAEKNEVTSYESDPFWEVTNKTYDAKWDLSKISEGTYTLRVKNIFEWAQPKLKSLTLSASIYTATYDANGGTCGTESETVCGGSVTLPTPTRAGYACTGWYTATSGGTKRGDCGGSYTLTADETLHAQWAAMPTVSGLEIDYTNATATSIPLSWTIPGICDLKNFTDPLYLPTDNDQGTLKSTSSYTEGGDYVTAIGNSPKWGQYGVGFDIPTTNGLEWLSFDWKGSFYDPTNGNDVILCGVFCDDSHAYWQYESQITLNDDSKWSASGKLRPTREYWDGSYVTMASKDISQVAIYANAGHNSYDPVTFNVRNVRYHTAGMVDIDHVVLMRKEGSAATDTTEAGTAVLLYSGKMSHYTDESVVKGKTYYYTVFSVHADGTLSAGTTQSVTVPKDDLDITYAAGTASSVTHNSATLPFTMSATTGVASVTLKVYKNSDNSLVNTIEGVTAATSGSGNVTGLDAETSYYFTVTPIGDATHNDGTESGKSATFTTSAAPTLSALVAGTLYEVPDMIPSGASLTSDDQFFEGLSANTKFTLMGSASSSTTPKVNNKPSNDRTIAGITFDDGSMWFKGNATVSENIPSTFGLSFIVPSAGKLYLYFDDDDASTNIKLAKSGTSGSKPTVSSGYSVVDVTSGTYYMYGTSESSPYSFYGLKFVPTYDITLHDNNGGDNNGSADVAVNGTTLLDIDAPTRSGYAVTGYYAEAECITLVADAEGNLEANVTVSAVDWTDKDGKWVKGSGATLYAKWGVVYTVTFNTNGGSSVDAITQTSEGASITMPAAPTKDGYTFQGWYIGSTSYAVSASYTPTADITAYASWKAECGVIKWDFTNYTDKDISLTGGASTEYTADDGATKMRYTAGSEDKIIAPNKGKLGYFKENGTTSSGSYKDTDGETAIGKNRLIRLFVEPGSGTLRINCNGDQNGVYKVLDGSASGTTLISSLSANTTSSSITLTTSPLWIETTTKGYINDIRWTPSSTVCYYVTYNGNGADGGYVNDPEAHSSGDNVTTLANSFTRTGCTFTGWNTASDGSGTAYAADGTISSISGNVTLYAQWKITVSENKNLSEYTSDALSTTDVVVTNGATLTVTEDTEVRNIIVETGSTLNVSTNSGSPITLSTRSLSLKGGWGRVGGETKYDMPRVYIDPKSTLTKTVNAVNFDIAVDERNYYPIALPFGVDLNDVNYVNSTLSSYVSSHRAACYGTYFAIKEYDGAKRAERGGNSENWKLVEEGILTPGKGYILSAVTVPDLLDADPYAVIRFPMSFTNGWTTEGEQGTVSEVTKNVIEVTAYEKAEGETAKANKGWNLLGIPYMSCYQTGADMYTGDGAAAIMQGKIDFKTNKFDNKDDIRYVSVPTHDFSEYLQYNIDPEEEPETVLLPGWCFFVQVETTGNLTYAVTNQEASSDLPIYAPKREQEMPTVKTGIILSSETASDKTTILVSDKYSVTDYEINADLEKMFGNGYTLATYSLAGTTRLAYNAMSNSDATNVIPIGYRAPADGEYTFAINPRYTENGAFEHVNLIDYETGFVTDLLVSSYSFATERTQNDTRFALNVVKAPQTATDITVTGDGLQVTGPQKVIINDKLYIIVDGKMYSAEGALVK